MNVSSHNPVALLKEQIVYEDNHILVINKLPSQLVQGDKTGDVPLNAIIQDFIKKRDAKPGNVYCGVIHRIDRPVSGLLVFAKTSKALSRFNELLRNRQLSKTYLAVVKELPPKQEDHLTHFLLRNEKLNMSRAFVKPVAHALKAELRYRVLASSDNYHLLGIQLITGRHHQIRAQLSAIGCAIKGDLKYGFPRSNKGGFIHLHSYHLEFLHPVKKEKMQFSAWPLGDDPVWRYFKQKNISAEEMWQ